MVWEDITARGVVAQGFRVRTLDARSAADAVQEDLRDKLVLLHQGLPVHFRIQHRYRPSTPFGQVLDEYDRVTALSPFPTVRATRAAHSRRFRGLAGQQKLRAEEIHVFVSTAIADPTGFTLTHAAQARHAQRTLTQHRGAFARFGSQVQSTFGELATVTPLSEVEHFRLLERTIDPAVESVGSAKQFDPEQSVGEQLLSSGIAGHAPHGIHVNGFYQAVLTLRAAPVRSESGLFHPLTTLPFNDYEVVVNVRPLEVEQVIRKKEHTIATLVKENRAAEQKGERSASKDETTRLEEEQIRQLYRGSQKVFAVTYAVRLWARTEADLTSMVGLAKRALESMGGAQSYLATLAVTTRKLFFATWPGWMFGYDRRELQMIDIDLADVLPFTSTFQGTPEAPEILLDGAGRFDAPRALVALPSFLGTPATAQHTLFLGSTGAGKTTALRDFAFQSSPYFEYECFLEEGGDYTPYAAAHGAGTLRIQSDGRQTINYLDTGGLPLSHGHLSFAAALALHMTGTPGQSEAVPRRKAILNHYLRLLYTHAATRWLRLHRDEAETVMREACAVQAWHRLHLAQDEGLLEAWTAIRDGLQAGDERVRSFVAGLSADEVFRFGHEPATRGLVEQHVLTRFRPEDYPQHAAFAELLLTHRMPEFRAEEVGDLATMLRNWTAGEGQYGPLFDGVTTAPLDARVVHLELGKIPEEQRELKTAVSLLMTGRIRQRIVNLPRDVRKRVVIEEMMRWLDVPDADKLIVEFCAQMRKYRCVVWMVVQQLQKLLETGIAPYVIGNCRQYIILKQLDRQDVAALAERLPGRLPEALQQEVLNFPTPENLPAGDRYSSFAYYNPNLVPPLAGTARLYLPTLS